MLNDEALAAAKRFGAFVASQRCQAGLTIEELAARLGCSAEVVRHVETHGADPSGERLVQVMTAVSPDGEFSPWLEPEFL